MRYLLLVVDDIVVVMAVNDSVKDDRERKNDAASSVFAMLSCLFLLYNDTEGMMMIMSPAEVKTPSPAEV